MTLCLPLSIFCFPSTFFFPLNLMMLFVAHYTIALIGAVQHYCLSNSFQCLNNNNTFNKYFYNTQTRISTTLKTEQQYLNTATQQAINLKVVNGINLKVSNFMCITKSFFNCLSKNRKHLRSKEEIETYKIGKE